MNISGINKIDLPPEEIKAFEEVENLAKEKGLPANARQCPYCNEVLFSWHEHDWKQCDCGYLFVDGGINLRFGIIPQEKP